MTDVIIIGSGPAGISAALYLQRGNLKTTIVAKDLGALEKAHDIENYYGFKEAISGKQLVLNGIAQAQKLGATYLNEEVVSISFDEGYTVKTTKDTYHAKRLILATGLQRGVATIKGLKPFEGKGVSYCAICDGFFYRQKEVVVIGSGDYALEEAQVLLPLAAKVTLLTNGQSIEANDERLFVDSRVITEICGEDLVSSVHFEKGDPLMIQGVFVALGTAGSTAFAKKLGIEMADNYIAVNQYMETNLPNLYAIGDNTGGLLQVAKAVYEGSVVGLHIVRESRK